MWARNGYSGGRDLVPVEPTLPLVNENTLKDYHM